MPPKRVLILGGTRDARLLADVLVKGGANVTSSMAGVTHHPQLPSGKNRRGGFGGVEGLKAYLREHVFDVVIDATHPFAVQISAHAVLACIDVTFLRLARRPWIAGVGDRWLLVGTMAAAVNALPPNAKVMLTVGRKELPLFFARHDLTGLARSIEPPDSQSDKFRLELAMPPFAVEQEAALLIRHDIEILVAKNSGGRRAEKLDAARRLGLPVVMVDMPQKLPAKEVYSIAEAVAAVLGTSGAAR